MHELLLQFLSLHQMTPLHLAAESGHIKKVNYLCDEGADINIQDNDGVNLNAGIDQLIESELAQFENNNLSIFKDHGNCLLHVLQLCLRRISTTKVPSKVETCVSCQSVIHYQLNQSILNSNQAKSGHVQIVNYLCDKGADINIQDNDGVILNAGRLSD